MRLGVFGGTFDPVHYGHLMLAEACRDALRLDAVWFIPAAVPPHKQSRELTPAVQRVEMLELAIGGNPAFAIGHDEIERGGVSFTVETLARLHESDPARRLFFLMGADSLLDLPHWKEPRRIVQLATPVTVRRGDFDLGDPAHALDLAPLAEILSADDLATIEQHQVIMPRIDLSSSDIRRCVAGGKSIRYRTPRAVEKYIETHGLYRE